MHRRKMSPCGSRGRVNEGERLHDQSLASQPCHARDCLCVGVGRHDRVAGAAEAEDHRIEPDAADVQSAGLEHHEGARARRQARLRAGRQALSVDLGVLRRLRHRRDRRGDRRADDPAEVLSGRRAAADFRHRLHARGPRGVRQGPQDQLARRPQGQAARRRHGRIAVPGAQDLRQRQGHSSSARTSPSSTPISQSPARSSKPTGSRRRW